MPGPYEMKIGNFTSATTFDLCNGYTGYQSQIVITSIAQYPESKLAPGASTCMEMNANDLGDLADGDAWINFGWKANGSYWGTKIYIRQQILDAGHQPYYEVSHGSNDTPSWSNPVGNPADPYDFPTSVGWAIHITPTAGHTSLTIEINVSDLS